MDCSSDLSSNMQNICYVPVLQDFISNNQITSSEQLLPVYHMRKLKFRDVVILQMSYNSSL